MSKQNNSNGYAKEWLTKEQWKKLINQEMSWRNELLLKTTYKGALRISETLRLKYPMDYQTEENKGYVIIRKQKKKDTDGNYKPETVPVGKDLIKETRRFFSQKDRDTRYVFSTRQSDQMTRQRVNQIIQDIAEEAGIEKKLGTHTLRRSRAKHLIDEGMDISVVSSFLRHENIKTTTEYLRIAKKHIAERTQEIDEEFNL